MQNWKFAINSIMGHKMRSFLTMLGIIIGVMSVVVIVALGSGMSNAFTDVLGGAQQDVSLFYSHKRSKNGDGVMTYQEMRDDAESGNGDETVSTEEEPQIQEVWVKQAVNDISGIDNYYVTNNTTATVNYGKKKADNIPITGINSTYFTVKKYQIVAGRTLKSNDYQTFARVVLLDTKLADILFGGADKALNQIVQLGSNNYRVIGVYKDPNETRNRLANMNNGNLLMANTQLAAEYNVAEIMNVVVHVKKLDDVLKDGSAAARLMTKLSGVREGEYQMFDQASQLAAIQSQVAIVQVVFGAIAGIALLVGGIGVMNIMLVSVTERTREIGLRKALGATRGNILMQFVIESMVLTAIGGLIGLALAALIVASIGHSLDAFFGAPPTITTVSAVGSVLFLQLSGLFSVFCRLIRLLNWIRSNPCVMNKKTVFYSMRKNGKKLQQLLIF